MGPWRQLWREQARGPLWLTLGASGTLRVRDEDALWRRVQQIEARAPHRDVRLLRLGPFGAIEGPDRFLLCARRGASVHADTLVEFPWRLLGRVATPEGFDVPRWRVLRRIEGRLSTVIELPRGWHPAVAIHDRTDRTTGA